MILKSSLNWCSKLYPNFAFSWIYPRELYAFLFLLFVIGICSPSASAQIAGMARTDIGSPSPTGTYSYSAPTYSVSGGGIGIAGTSDSFTYVNTSTSGNIEIIARVASQTNPNNYAVAGLMMRDSLNANGANATIGVSPANGVNFTYRAAAGGTTDVHP